MRPGLRHPVMSHTVLTMLLVAGGGHLPAAHAAPGDIVNSGAVPFNLGGVNGDAARAVAVQSDGRMILAGTATTATGWTLVLARVRPDRTLDPSFGTNGKVVNPFGLSYNLDGVAVELLPNGRILVAGTIDWGGGDHDFWVGRLQANGATDLSFAAGDGNRYVAFDVGDDHTDNLSAMAVDQHDRIILVGTVDIAPGDSDLGVVRLSPAGDLDTSFSGDGRTTVAASAAADLGLGVAVTPSSGVVVSGAAWTTVGGGHFTVALARLLVNGALDTSFASGGLLVYPILLGGNNNSFAWDVAVWPDGGVVVGGDAAVGTNEWGWVLLSFSSGGLFMHGADGAFCAAGIPPCASFRQDSIHALRVVGEDSILVAGQGIGLSGDADFGIGRFNRDLSPDTTFGDGGTATYDFNRGPGGRADGGAAMALAPNGTVVVAGTSEWSGFDSDFAWARFYDRDIFADGFESADLASWSAHVP